MFYPNKNSMTYEVPFLFQGNRKGCPYEWRLGEWDGGGGVSAWARIWPSYRSETPVRGKQKP